jgi:hypothetical protein
MEILTKAKNFAYFVTRNRRKKKLQNTLKKKGGRMENLDRKFLDKLLKRKAR